MYYIKLKDKDLYLNINTKINDKFYCINVTLSKLPHLWLYNQDDKIITNYQTKGNIIHKYHGWLPETSNIILLNDITFDIYFKPLIWDYKDFILSTIINNVKYILCVNNDNNIILKKENNLHFSQEWDFIPFKK